MGNDPQEATMPMFREVSSNMITQETGASTAREINDQAQNQNINFQNIQKVSDKERLVGQKRISIAHPSERLSMMGGVSYKKQEIVREEMSEADISSPFKEKQQGMLL